MGDPGPNGTRRADETEPAEGPSLEETSYSSLDLSPSFGHAKSQRAKKTRAKNSHRRPTFRVASGVRPDPWRMKAALVAMEMANIERTNASKVPRPISRTMLQDAERELRNLPWVLSQTPQTSQIDKIPVRGKVENKRISENDIYILDSPRDAWGIFG